MMQRAFAAALLNPSLPTPPDLVRPDLMRADTRFAVYRNNVVVGLTEALRQGFPVVCKLVGDDFFSNMASVFIRQHPPRSRLIMMYGTEFADFLAKFPAVAELPYLPDVARLEHAIRESYHATDAAAVAPETLAALPEAQFLTARVVLAPSLRLIRSPWPLHAIWAANMENGPTPSHEAQNVVVLRPDFDPRPFALSPAGGRFLAALLSGLTIAEAISLAGPLLELSQVLTLLLQGHAITGLTP